MGRGNCEYFKLYGSGNCVWSVVNNNQLDTITCYRPTPAVGAEVAKSLVTWEVQEFSPPKIGTRQGDEKVKRGTGSENCPKKKSVLKNVKKN